jgi:predicted ATP-grasp superfamily ATP-dependent carboligase
LTYHGGTYPLPPSLSKRADRLARRAVGSLNESLNEPLGFIGVDMVLGDDPNGGEDFVIEINPRLTTSYVGLRVASRTNLAQALLDVAAGNRPDLSFDPARLEFDADGTVRRLECDDSSSRSFSKHADSQSQLADQFNRLKNPKR